MLASDALDRRIRDSDVPAAAVLLLVVVPLAAWLYADFLAEARLLWRGMEHDRNGHFQFGLSLALDLFNLDLVAFATDLNRATVWPPLHGLVLALVLLVGGFDERLGVLPSLAGWVITVVATALVARRMVPRSADGAVAAAIALIFVAASPGLRDYALDVMLESLGAALTAVSLYLYLRAKTEPAPERWWRAFALLLTLLFFEKGNYWGLLVGGLVLAEVAADPLSVRAVVGAIAARLSSRAFWSAQARAPLTWVFAALVAAVAVLLLRGPTSITLLGRPVSLYPPQNLTTAAYWVAFIRVIQAWRRSPPAPGTLSSAQRIVVAWHVLPVAAWFLLPRRISGFLWFVGPLNGGVSLRFDQVAGFTQYLDWATQLYHAAPASAGVAVALAAIAALNMRRLARGSGAVLAVCVVSMIGVSLHPYRQPRFLGSWLPTLWMLAGAGGAIVLAAMPAALGPAALGPAPLGRWRRAIAAASLVGLVWWHASALTRAWQPPAWAGPAAGSDLDITPLYLERLPADRRIGFASTVGGQAFFTWTVLARSHDPRKLDLFKLFEGWDRDRVRADFDHWVRTTETEILVVVEGLDARFDVPQLGLVNADLARIFADALQAYGGFARGEERADAGVGVRVTLWTRVAR